MLTSLEKELTLAGADKVAEFHSRKGLGISRYFCYKECTEFAAELVNNTFEAIFKVSIFRFADPWTNGSHKILVAY